MPTLWDRLNGALGAFWSPTPTRAPGRPYRPPARRREHVGEALSRWASKTQEKVRTHILGGHLRFLPWLDQYTEETQEIRAEYLHMLKDPAIKAGFLTKVLSVCQLPLQVHPQDPDDPRHQACAEFVKFCFKKIGVTDEAGEPRPASAWSGPVGCAWSILSGGILRGHSVSELLFEREPMDYGRFRGKRRWKALKSKDTQYLQLSIDQFRNITAIRGTAYNAGKVFKPEDFVIYTYLPLYESPVGMSDFRAAYAAYWHKDAFRKLWGLHLDKYSGPWLKGTYSTAAQKQALEQAFENARGGGWITVPTGALVEATSLAVSGSTDFEAAIRYCDQQILIALVGAHLQVLEGQVSGARGDTEVHKETSQLFQWLLAETLANVYQTQMVPELVRHNYHDVEPPDITLGSVSETEMQARASIDKALQDLGLKLSKKETYSYFGRSEPTDPDDILEPPGASQPPPGGPGGPGGGAGGLAGLLGGGGGGAGGEPEEAEPFAEHDWASMSESDWEAFASDDGWEKHKITRGPRKGQTVERKKLPSGSYVYRDPGAGAAKEKAAKEKETARRAAEKAAAAATKAKEKEVAKAAEKKTKALSHLREIAAGRQKPTPARVRDIGAVLVTLKADELKTLKAELGVKGGSTKAQMVERIQAKALAKPEKGKGKAEPAAKKEPAAKPAASPQSPADPVHALERYGLSPVEAQRLQSRSQREGFDPVAAAERYADLSQQESRTGSDLIRRAITEEKDQQAVDAASSGKESWQLTREEYARTEHALQQSLKDFDQPRRTFEQALAGLEGSHREQMLDLLTAGRKATVESALAAGKPVPAEVLADYPDLAARYPQPPEPGFTGTDSLGREWRDGKLVAAQEKPATAKPARAKPEPKAKPKAAAPAIEREPGEFELRPEEGQAPASRDTPMVALLNPDDRLAGMLLQQSWYPEDQERTQQAHALREQIQAQARMVTTRAEFDGLMDQYEADLERIGQGFTGTDSLGREWRNGKLVAKGEEPASGEASQSGKSEGEPDNRPAHQMTPEERQREIARIKNEERSVLATPLVSEGNLSPFQLGQMSDRQRKQYQANVMRRMELEARIRDLGMADADLATEQSAVVLKKAEGRASQIASQLDQIDSMAKGYTPGKPNMVVGANGKLKPKYQRTVDVARAELATLAGQHPEIAQKYAKHLPAASPATQPPAPDRHETFRSSAGESVPVPVYDESKIPADFALPNEPALRASVQEIVAELRFRWGASLPVPLVYDKLRERHPDLSLADFHRQLIAWQKQDQAVLQIANDPDVFDSDELAKALAAPTRQGGAVVHGYVLWRAGADSGAPTTPPAQPSAPERVAPKLQDRFRAISQADPAEVLHGGLAQQFEQELAGASVADVRAMLEGLGYAPAGSKSAMVRQAVEALRSSARIRDQVNRIGRS